MSLASQRTGMELPASLQSQLHDFRRRVWTIKTIEAVGGAIFGLAVAVLLVFALDRLGDTPRLVRLAIFAATVGLCASVPIAIHRWVWRRRKLEQLARLLSLRYPSIGDQLLGIIELVRSESEQARSRALCEAAIVQVAEQASKKNLLEAVPHPRHRRWAALAIAGSLLVATLGALFPEATANAWARLMLPWKDTPRYTFTKVNPLPEVLVVAHGEPFSLHVQLDSGSRRHPAFAEGKVGQQQAVRANASSGDQAESNSFELAFPGQIEPGTLVLNVGDYRQKIRIEPTLRPELVSLVARVTLPDYLGRDGAQTKDVRGGSVSLVDGSRAVFVATASRELSQAMVDGEARTPEGKQVASGEKQIQETRKLEFSWQDRFGLTNKEPFALGINRREDEAPSLTCEDLPRQKVVLDTETLKFRVAAQDDFGIKRVGVEWQGIDSTTIKDPAKGERILAAGGPDRENLELSGTFSAQSLGISPQPIQLRIFAEDYLPERERVYSPVYTLYVLNAEQHAIWLTEQLSKWHRQSLEVRDKEMQLYETNRQLREQAESDLDSPEMQRKLDAQASAERANGRRLSALTAAGEDLIQQATRNPEFGVGHLEKWAEMLQILKDISDNRMPSVAELLKQSAQAAARSPGEQPRMAGQNRNEGSSSSGQNPDPKTPPKAVPQIVDVESSQQPRDKDDQKDQESPKSQSQGSLGLPSTALAGSGKGKSPACQKMDEAIAQQQDLLAEFDKIADELNRILANLEGSTLVKRLKAAARMQYKIGGRLADQVSGVFGSGGGGVESIQQLFQELSKQEMKSSQDVSVIMDDMQAYFERRRMMKFKTVLDDMRKLDVIGCLRQLSDDLFRENGLSVAQCDYWSDNLDRWAEDLVDPASGGS